MHLLNDPAVWLKQFFLNAGLSFSLSSFLSTAVLLSFIDAWHKIYNTLPISLHRHIKGYVQLVKIFVVLIAVMVIVSVVFRQDISSLLTGLGAMAAVLILVFKDTLPGLVASIQLSADKMLKVFQQPTGEDILSLSKNSISNQ